MTHITTTRRRVGPRAFGLAALLALSLALCGTLANAASAAVGSVQRTSASSATDSSTVKTVTVYCPARTRVIGTAGRVTDGGGQVLLEDIAPNAQLTGVTVTAHEDTDGWNGNWYVTATAICGYPAGLELVSWTYAQQMISTAKYTTMSCPNGKQLLGTGVAVSGVDEHNGVIAKISPNAQLTNFFVEVANHENFVWNAIYWAMTGYAICADPPPGLERVAAISPSDSAPTGGKSVTAFCPSGKQLLDTGAEVSGATGGQVSLTGIGPVNPLTQSSTATALEGQLGTTGNWSATAYAICAPA